MTSDLSAAVDDLLDRSAPWSIVTAGDPVLRRPTQPYQGELGPDALAALIAGMRTTMLAAPGVGLAAPQIGLPLRLAVLEDAAPVAVEIAMARGRVPLPFRVLVNPEYEPLDDSRALFFEGCLSVPGYHAAVARPTWIRLTGLDENGHELDETVQGWPARIVAHETDHLNGGLYLDRAELRSLTSVENYLTRWAEPRPDAARSALDF